MSEGLAGSAGLVLVGNVVPLDPEPALYAAMLDGWRRQQTVRFLTSETVDARINVVNRLRGFTDLYPWQWETDDVEAFFAGLVTRERPIAASTLRNMQGTLRMFLDFVTDSRYGWPEACREQVGAVPRQLLHEWNTLRHSGEFEGRPGRRPLSYDEVQALFDAADGRVEAIRRSGRKGALTAHRDAVLLKVVYAFGLRRREAGRLELADLRSNPKVPGFGRCGALFVRWGKSSRGGPPKRRTVLTVPEMDWVVPLVAQWIDELRPRFSPGSLGALWVNERRARLSLRSVDDAFAKAREAAGLPPELELHCLRHSYVTHLIEFGYPAHFVQFLLSRWERVHNVQHEPEMSGDLCGDGGYLPPSITQFPRRSDAGAEGVDARLVA